MDIQNAQIRPIISQGMKKYGGETFAAMLIASAVCVAAMIPFLIVFGIAVYFFESMMVVSAVLITIVYIALVVFMCVVLYGLDIFPLKAMREGRVDYGTLFIGFANFKRVAALTLWVFLWSFLWCLLLLLPFGVTFTLYLVTEQDIVLVSVVLSYILGLVGICIVSMRYAQVYYVLYDNPDMPVRQVLRHSIEMMKGNKKQFFFLIVSALWWQILALIGVCIAFSIALIAESIFLCVLLGLIYAAGIVWISIYSAFISPSFYQALITKVTPPEEAEAALSEGDGSGDPELSDAPELL
jgi:uncharacterized membrane protein